MNEVLLDAIRHNNWANTQLVAFCRGQNLTAQQLQVTGVGTYGGILETLSHIITCDGSYLRRLADSESLRWADGSTAEADFDVLEQWAEEARLLWEDTLSKPIEVERVIIVDGGTRGTRAGILIAQALNHANHHREQVCAILTGFGIEPPDIQAWEYAWHTERIWDLPSPGDRRWNGRAGGRKKPGISDEHRKEPSAGQGPGGTSAQGSRSCSWFGSQASVRRDGPRWRAGRGGWWYRPKSEDDITDWFQRRVMDLLPERVVPDRELQVQRRKNSGIGERADLTVTVGACDRLIRTVVEAKTIGNDEVTTALQDQLVERYLRPMELRHGIYLVYWLSSEQRPSSWNKSRGADRETFLRELREQSAIARAAGFHVEPYLLDISRS